MKKFAFFAALLLSASLRLHAQTAPPNVYDVVSRVLTPIASVFSPEAKQHALSATLVLEEMTDLPPELAGTRMELFLQPPDKLLVRGLYEGQMVTLCRSGQAFWAAPNVPPVNELANPPGSKKNKSAAGFEPMVLPFPPQQLALLPVFLQVMETASEEKGGRTLDVKLMPELARSLGVDAWSAQLSMNAANQLTRLRIRGPGWRLALRVEQLTFSTELPPTTWQMPADSFRLDARQVQQWLDFLGRPPSKDAQAK